VDDLDASKEFLSVEFFTDSFGYSELTVSLFELNLTNRNIKTLATLGKAIYGCKNILKRGKKRELFQHLLSKSTKI